MAIDAIGSAAVLAAVAARHPHENSAQRLGRFSRMATVDLQINYLGEGVHGLCAVNAKCLTIDAHLGRSEIELHDPKGHMVAKGFGTYVVS